MSNQQDPTPVFEALDRFLDQLRREFHDNPELAYRVVKALGAEVVFDSDYASQLLNPRELVAQKSESDACEVLERLSASDLKSIAKQHRLASAVDMKGKDKPALVRLVYRRACDSVAERMSSR